MISNYRVLFVAACLSAPATQVLAEKPLAIEPPANRSSELLPTLTTQRALLEHGGVFAGAFTDWEFRLSDAKRDRDQAVREVTALLADYHELTRKLRDWHLEPETPLRVRLLAAARIVDTAERGLVFTAEGRVSADPTSDELSALELRCVRQTDARLVVRDALQTLSADPSTFRRVIELLAQAAAELDVNSGTAKFVAPSGVHVSTLLQQVPQKRRARDRILQRASKSAPDPVAPPHPHSAFDEAEGTQHQRIERNELSDDEQKIFLGLLAMFSFGGAIGMGVGFHFVRRTEGRTSS